MSESTYPTELKYHEAHDWVRTIDDGIVEFGVTWHAQDALGDIVYFAPPEVGAITKAGDPYGELESVKAVSDLISPIDGEVVEVNEAIADSPEQVNDDPYAAWLVRVRPSDTAQIDALMDAESYMNLIK